ncbi:MAG TPA: AarF/ABC1/UbiB kinase family protein, partial [Halanaerobiales bacterium]|nr:AarF/ABC1/UbiB kinase family protein [Halanaerobiales bacterium]
MFDLKTQYRHFQRYRKITEVLLRHGLGAIIEWLDLGKFLPLGKRLKKRGELKKGDLSKRVCSVLQELGPTYIKFGQLLST